MPLTYTSELVQRGKTPATYVEVHDKGKNVGYLRHQPAKDKSHVVLDALYVDPTYRGKGIASELVRRAIAANEGKELRLNAHPYKDKSVSAEALKGFYRQHGFTEVGDDHMIRTKIAALAIASFEDVIGEIFKLAAPNLMAAKQHFGNAVNILKTVKPSVPRPSLATPGGPMGSLKQMVHARKTAGLGIAASKASNVGRLKGLMSTHALKSPGPAASTVAMNPRKNVIAAMNKAKPH